MYTSFGRGRRRRSSAARSPALSAATCGRLSITIRRSFSAGHAPERSRSTKMNADSLDESGSIRTIPTRCLFMRASSAATWINALSALISARNERSSARTARRFAGRSRKCLSSTRFPSARSRHTRRRAFLLAAPIMTRSRNAKLRRGARARARSSRRRKVNGTQNPCAQ